MNLMLGLIVMVASVLGGYVAHGGELLAIWQPTEVVIILGAAIGGMIIANPPRVLFKILKAAPSLLTGSTYTQKDYLELFLMLNELLAKIRKEGLLAVESDIDDPSQSPLFSKYPKILRQHHTIEFLQDYLRLMVSGAMNPYQLENLMDIEISTHHHDAEAPGTALSKVSDALPGFGIVAAVLGIVNTMGALGGPVEEVGVKVAAALVGTFLGVLLAYGVFGPISTALEYRAKEETQWFTTLKTALMAQLQGHNPLTSIEFSRKATPSDLRPSYRTLEEQLRGNRGS